MAEVKERIEAAIDFAVADLLEGETKTRIAHHANRIKAEFFASHAPAPERGTVTIEQAREWRQTNWYDKVPEQLDVALAAFANSVIYPEDSPAPSAPATGKEEVMPSETRLGEGISAVTGAAHPTATQSGASATQGAREFANKQHLGFVQNGMVDINGRYLDGIDICQFAEDYAASFRSEVERLKAERDEVKHMLQDVMSAVICWRERSISKSQYEAQLKNSNDLLNRLSAESTLAELRAREATC